MSTENLLKEDLKKCTTINQVIDCVDKYYDLDQPLGVMSKGVVNSGIMKVIKMTGTKARK